MTELARGTYRYWHDGTLQAITEPWQLLRTPQGLVLHGRRVVGDDTVLEVEAAFANARCTSMTAFWKRHDATQARSARFRLDGRALHWRMQNSDGADLLTLPDDCVMFPLLRAAAGPLIRQLSQRQSWVVLPNLTESIESPPLLHPLLSQRQATALGQDPELGQRFRYVGGEYAESGADYWLDAHAIVQHYAWQAPHGRWDVRLEDYWAASRFTGFG